MAATTHALLDRATLKQSDSSSAEQILDLGDADALEIVLAVDTPCEGEGARLVLRHAPSLTSPQWLDFPVAVAISLHRKDRIWISAPRFTRYVGWAVEGVLTTDAIASVEIVPK